MNVILGAKNGLVERPNSKVDNPKYSVYLRRETKNRAGIVAKHPENTFASFRVFFELMHLALIQLPELPQSRPLLQPGRLQDPQPQLLQPPGLLLLSELRPEPWALL